MFWSALEYKLSFIKFKEFIMANASTKYTKTAIILHWLIGFGIIFMFFLGWYMGDLPKEAPKSSSYDLFDLGLYTWQLSEEVSPRTFYFNLHKSLGISILALIIFRVFWRLTHPAPSLIKTMKVWEKKLASATHHALYLIMVLVPLSGVAMAVYSKYGIKWFGIPLAEGLGDDAMRDIFKESHEIIGIILLLLLGLHILAVLKHTFVNKDGTLKRMTFK
jgi:cytochrome b561